MNFFSEVVGGVQRELDEEEGDKAVKEQSEGRRAQEVEVGIKLKG